MRRRIEALADQLEEFVSEDGHDALVIDGDASAGGLLGAAIDLVEQRGSIDVSFPWLDAFESEQALAAKLVSEMRSFANEAGLEAAPREPEPADPLTGLVDTLFHFARAVRTRGDVRVAVWLCPTFIADEDAYLRLALRLVHACRGSSYVRVTVREPSTDGALRAALRRAGHPVLTAAVDMSRAAARDALAEEALDETLSPATRAAALLTVVCADAASGHGERSLPVLAELASVFAALGDEASRALCLVGAGSALVQLGRLDEARQRVSQGLAIAVAAQAIPVVLSSAMLAGDLAMRAGDPVEADLRFDVVARLAARLPSPVIVAQALIERGSALAARGMERAACDAWTCAASAARRAKSDAHEHLALSAIANVYREAGITTELAPIERRLDSLAHAGCSHEHAS